MRLDPIDVLLAVETNEVVDNLHIGTCLKQASIEHVVEMIFEVIYPDGTKELDFSDVDD